MALTPAKPPAEGPNIIRKALASLSDSPHLMAAAIGGAAPLDLAAPHPVYFVGLKAVADGQVLSQAELKGWRYVLLQGDTPTAAAELDVGRAGGKAAFSQLNRGPFVASTVEGVRFAEKLDAVRRHNYELRLLRIPALYIIALWLHGQKDLIIPLPPTHPKLKPYTTYSEKAFAKAIKAAASKKLTLEATVPG